MYVFTSLVKYYSCKIQLYGNRERIYFVVHGINKFHHYIIGYLVFLHTDHIAIQYLMTKPITNGRVTKWLLLIQEFNITICYKPIK
jgi:hypothetical protein